MSRKIVMSVVGGLLLVASFRNSFANTAGDDDKMEKFATLDKFKVPEKKRNEVVAFIASLKGDIVES